MAILRCGPAPAEQLVTRDAAPLFGTAEVGSHDLSIFPKWRHTLQAFGEEVKNCRPGGCAGEWWTFVESLRGEDVMTQLRETNVRLNEKSYVSDSVNWSVPDYWETPFQFMSKGGDCEDYAIAKYMMLRDLGIPADAMRIVVLQDLSLHVDHAVLAVHIGGTHFILDNRYSDIVPANLLPNYQPLYSINENGWWLHLPEPDSSILAENTKTIFSMTRTSAAPPVGVDVGGTFTAQLASLPTRAAAIAASEGIRARYPDIIKDLDLSTRRVDLGAKGIWYRVLAGQFGPRDTANSLCTRLRTANPPAACIVVAAW